MSSRERTVTVKPEEWFGTSPAQVAFRTKTLEDARRTAQRNLWCVRIKVKDRKDTRVVATIDARYWMHEKEARQDARDEKNLLAHERAIIQKLRLMNVRKAQGNAGDERRRRAKKMRAPGFIFDE